MIDRKIDQLQNISEHLGRTIQKKLHIPYASLSDPRDLALAAVSAYTAESEQFNFIIPFVNQHVIQVADSYAPWVYKQAGISKREFTNMYPDLIGRDGNFRNGKLADGLRRSRNCLPPEDQRKILKDSAELFARYLQIYPGLLPESPIGITVEGQKAFLRMQNRFYFVKKNLVLQYGLGLESLGRIPGEVTQVGESILMSGNPFIKETLAVSSRLVGAGERVRTALNSDLTLNGLPKGVFDLITMSDLPEGEKLDEDIDYLYSLLKQGGHLAISIHAPNGEKVLLNRIRSRLFKLSHLPPRFETTPNQGSLVHEFLFQN